MGPLSDSFLPHLVGTDVLDRPLRPAPYAKRGLRPTDLIAFDWDHEQPLQARPATPEDFERIKKQFDDEEVPQQG